LPRRGLQTGKWGQLKEKQAPNRQRGLKRERRRKRDNSCRPSSNRTKAEKKTDSDSENKSLN